MDPRPNHGQVTLGMSIIAFRKGGRGCCYIISQWLCQVYSSLKKGGDKMDPRPNHGQVTLGMSIIAGELASRCLQPAKCTYNSGTRLFVTPFGSVSETDVIAATNGDCTRLNRSLANMVMHLRRN